MMMKRRRDQQAGRRDSNVGSGGSNYLALCDYCPFIMVFDCRFCFERRPMREAARSNQARLGFFV